MITVQKSAKGGWTVEKMTFPKGFYPSSVKWRSKDGLHYVWVDRLLQPGQEKLTNLGSELEEREIKVVRGKNHLVGWLLQEQVAYDYDRETASGS